MAGAVATSRTPPQQEAQHEQNRQIADMMQRRLSQQRGVLKVRTSTKFDALSEDGLWLLESQVDQLLALVMMMREDRLDSDAVQMVVDTAHRSQKQDGLIPPPYLKGAVTKKHIVMAVEKYPEYIRCARQIDQVFEQYDKEGDGYLSKQELTQVLQDYEKKCHRCKRGIPSNLVVTQEDVDWIIAASDSDKTGMINHAEYLTAIAAWEELAQMKLESESNSCIIL